MKDIIVREAEEPDGEFAKMISDEMEASAIARLRDLQTVSWDDMYQNKRRQSRDRGNC